MSEVELIFEKLDEMHDGTGQYTKEQLRSWAHMLQMRKHDSYEVPPKKPFFKKSRVNADDGKIDGLSPGKRIRCRSECINQLDKWHSLMERGAGIQRTATNNPLGHKTFLTVLV